MVINKVSLKFFDLIIVENFLRELPDAGVRAVHDFFIREFFLQHSAADLDALQSFGSQFNFFIIAPNGREFFNGRDEPSRTIVMLHSPEGKRIQYLFYPLLSLPHFRRKWEGGCEAPVGAAA